MAPMRSAQSSPGVSDPRPRRSLSRRVLLFTLIVMIGTEILVFLPTLASERRNWMDRHVASAELAVLTAPARTFPDKLNAQERRREILRLAGAISVRVQEPGRPLTELAENGMVMAESFADLRAESVAQAIGAAMRQLMQDDDGLLQIVAPSERRINSLLFVVVDAGELGAHLRSVAGQIALQGLAVALVTGALIYWALVLMLVRPMRRLTGSIQAFRADPERSPPIEPLRLGQDEIAMATAELAAMQRELRAALWRNARLAAIGTAVAKVSHDLRGILSPALLAAERLQHSTDDKTRANGDTVARSVERATELVRRTLDFARSDPTAPQRSSLSLRGVGDDAAEQARAVNAAFTFDNRVPTGFLVNADRMHLLRILGNLIRNAAEAGAKRITLTAERTIEQIVITLEDDGPGLPARVRADLFRPFVGGGRRGGSGLGIAIAHDLIRAHGGDIVLIRTGPDGTGFRLTLPQGEDATTA